MDGVAKPNPILLSAKQYSEDIVKGYQHWVVSADVELVDRLEKEAFTIFDNEADLGLSGIIRIH